jgi:hypothetical protein
LGGIDMSDGNCACNLPHPQGSAHPEWKGDDASYTAMHHRVYRARGKADSCITPDCTSDGPFQWANITGNYGDIWDYQKMCRTHHDAFDRPWEKRRGEQHCRAKITEAAVREIRRRFDDAEQPARLAREYRISESQVHRIGRRQSWKWLN